MVRALELWLIVRTSSSGDRELVFDVDGDTPLRQLIDSAAHHLGLDGSLDMYSHRMRRVLDPTATVRDGELRFGDTVTIAPPGWAASAHVDTEEPVAVIAVV